MQFGTYMGIFWTLKFILIPLGFKIEFLFLLYFCLTCAVPIIGYFYLKAFRDRVFGGAISFGQACLFTLMMYMFASLLASVIHYVYFAFIDGGFIINEYTRMVQEVFNTTPGMDEQKEAIELVLDEAKSMTAIDITLQYLSLDIIFCSILSIPTALIGMRKRKATTNDVVNQ